MANQNSRAGQWCQVADTSRARDEGFIGRGEAAYGNAEHWERVLAWLASYMQFKAE